MRLLASSVLLALCAACASNPDARSVDVDAQLATLREALVHVERPDPASPLLLADASAVASSIDDARAELLFAPLASRWRDLSLARTGIGASFSPRITASLVAGICCAIEVSSVACPKSGCSICSGYFTLHHGGLACMSAGSAFPHSSPFTQFARRPKPRPGHAPKLARSIT